MNWFHNLNQSKAVPSSLRKTNFGRPKFEPHFFFLFFLLYSRTGFSSQFSFLLATSPASTFIKISLPAFYPFWAFFLTVEFVRSKFDISANFDILFFDCSLYTSIVLALHLCWSLSCELYTSNLAKFLFPPQYWLFITLFHYACFFFFQPFSLHSLSANGSVFILFSIEIFIPSKLSAILEKILLFVTM